MSEHKQTIPIWFFVGLQLIVYGLLILGSGLYDLLAGVKRDTVLAELHIGVWWGALLLFLGLLYSYMFNPARKRR
jgi:hypothetical protein